MEQNNSFNLNNIDEIEDFYSDTENLYKPKEKSVLLDNGLVNGFVSGAVSVPAGISHFASGVLKTDGEIGTKLYELSSDFKREKDYSLSEIKEKPLDYITDYKNGATYTIGSAVGSTVANMAVVATAVATAEVTLPSAAATVVAPALVTAKKIIPGMKYFNSTIGKVLVSRALRGIPESMKEGGKQWYEITHNEDGSLKDDVNMAKARNSMLKETAVMMPVAVALSSSQAKLEEKALKSVAKGMFKTARHSGIDIDIIPTKEGSLRNARYLFNKKVDNNILMSATYLPEGKNEKFLAKVLRKAKELKESMVVTLSSVLVLSDSETHRNFFNKKEPEFEKFVFKPKRQKVLSKGKQSINRNRGLEDSHDFV